MGLFNKLKEILFDEETVEIPVITKEEKGVEAKKKREEKHVQESKNGAKRHQSDDEEVIIEKIETPKRESSNDVVDTLFDMPKLKDDFEPVEAEKEKKINTFTFPVFNDDDKIENTRRAEKKKKEASVYKSREDRKGKEEKTTKVDKSSGYTNAYDYSYGKYKGDYMTSREENRELLAKTLSLKEEKKAFTPSPIISPVYGVLNENYKKEDIVSKRDKTPFKEVLDLDSVRKKAYGTLEDDIEASLNSVDEVGPDGDLNDDYAKREEEVDFLEEDGISIDDLLVDDAISSNENSDNDGEIELVEDVEEDTELFSVLDEEPKDEIDLEPVKHEQAKEVKEFSPIKRRETIESTKEPLIPDDAEEVDLSKETDDKNDSVKEEDLFDLIDSLYEGKEEE